MGRFKDRMNKYQYDNFSTDEKYNLAYKRVKRIKGFYIHLIIYLAVNTFLICGIFYDQEFTFQKFMRWETFSTALFWGIGLASHGFSVFGRNILFNKDWEERKIQEFINKEQENKFV